MVRRLETTYGDRADFVVMLGSSDEARRNAVRLGIDDPPHGTYVFGSDGKLFAKRPGHAYGEPVVVDMIDRMLAAETEGEGTTETRADGSDDAAPDADASDPATPADDRTP